MAISQPGTTNILSSPDHSLLHRIIAADVAAAVKSLVVDANGNVGIGTETFGTSAAKVLAIPNGTVPSTSPADSIQLYAVDVSSSSELKVRDEAGNITALGPHVFKLFKKPHPLAWSYYSERGNYIINVDMFGFVKAVEELSGEKLIYLN